jgi:hypothetical protein
VQTILNLLTRDGTVYMAFSPHLTPDQYAELVRLSDMCATADELRMQVAAWAAEVGVSYSMDEAEELA